MDDLISRQAAIEAAIEGADEWGEGYSDSRDEMITNAIDKVPSAQPEIIRCKDCKHWREGTAFSYCDKLHGMGVLDALDYMTAEDDYCSMAEREADERQT